MEEDKEKLSKKSIKKKYHKQEGVKILAEASE